MKYTCLIVDDERPALKLLAAYIAKLPQLELVDACESALQALSVLQSQSVDLLFLEHTNARSHWIGIATIPF